MDIDTFLKRIEFDGPTTVDLTTLNALQTAFVQTVPFENLVIHQNIAINYDSAVELRFLWMVLPVLLQKDLNTVFSLMTKNILVCIYSINTMQIPGRKNNGRCVMH